MTLLIFKKNILNILIFSFITSTSFDLSCITLSGQVYKGSDSIKAENDASSNIESNAQNNNVDEQSHYYNSTDNKTEILLSLANTNPKVKNGIGANKVYFFFDYRCGYCKKIAESIALIKNKKNTNIYFIESPILGEESSRIAIFSTAFYKLYPEKYQDFNRLLLSSKKINMDRALQLAKKMSANIERIMLLAAKEEAEIRKQLKYNSSASKNISGKSSVPILIVNNTLINNDSINARQISEAIAKTQIPPINISKASR